MFAKVPVYGLPVYKGLDHCLYMNLHACIYASIYEPHCEKICFGCLGAGRTHSSLHKCKVAL